MEEWQAISCSMKANERSSFTSFHVFINYRLPDVKNCLASLLYEILQYMGLKVFLDWKQASGFLPACIEHAIRTCPIHIAIFSPNYASSPWCLPELALMLKTKARIVPVFYNVQPSDLRYADKGVYADTFARIEEEGKYLDKLPEWKEALHKASFISGIIFQTDDDMGNLCKNIVDTVLTEMKNAKQSFRLDVAEYPVGLDDAMQKLETIITSPNYHNSTGKIIAIVGVAGVGKTTLAKEFYNQYHFSYNRSSFVSNVREAHANKAMTKLQDQLISDLCLPLSTSILRRGGGAEMIKSQLHNLYSRALVILDDIDNLEQLQAFAVDEFVIHGALVVITTRDMHLFPPLGMRPTYFEMEGLDANDARELLCWHAFRQSCPPNDCEKMVEDFLRTSGGLPSSIVTLGQHLYTMMGCHIKP